MWPHRLRQDQITYGIYQIKNRLTTALGLNLLSALLVFLLIPIFMIGNNTVDFHFLDGATFFKVSLTASLILFSCLCACIFITQKFKLYKIQSFITYFILSWVVISGFYFPASQSVQQSSPELAPVNSMHMIITLLSASFLAFIGITKFSKYINVFFIITISVSIIPAASNIYSANLLRKNMTSDSILLSKTRNIMVISFDGMQGSIMKQVVETNELYSEALKDFILFDNTITNAQTTSISLLYELYGSRNYKELGGNLISILNKLKEEGVTDSHLVNTASDFYHYGYSPLSPNKMTIASNYTSRQNKISTIDFFKYPLVRIFSNKILQILDWDYLHFSSIEKKVNIIEQMQSHNVSDYIKRFILSMDLYDSFVDSIDITSKELSIRYLHFTFTHYPVQFDENCSYQGFNEAWSSNNQNSEGLKNQTKCSTQKIITFIEKLKKLGIYDKTLIVFKSDHGKPANYFDTYPESLGINGSMYGYNRFRPVLMIKDFNSTQNKLTINSRRVFLSDLSRTLCEAAKNKLECEKYYNNINLLESRSDQGELQYLHVMKNKRSDARFSTQEAISTNIRRDSLLNVLKQNKNVSFTDFGNSKSNFIIRLQHIEKIKIALDDHKDSHGYYPPTKNWSGGCKRWGETTIPYIVGLTPDFIDFLPLDPRKSTACEDNYIYKSNGQDYKFLVSNPLDYDLEHVPASYLDPLQNNKSYGVWTENAKKWQ